MTKLLSAASYAASKTLSLKGQSIKRSQLAEVLAAMLGYQTYAALTVEERDDSLDYHLDDAEMLVLNTEGAERRANELRVGDVPGLIHACVSALRSVAAVSVHESLVHFYDEYGREALIDAIANSGDVSAAISETNAFFDSEVDLPYALPVTDDLWSARLEWSIEASGDLKGSHEIESDRMFTGDTLNCYGKVTFIKAGRAGLIFFESEGTGGVDESWREKDRDDEAEYMESLARLDRNF